MGRVRLTFDWDWKGAEASYSRALELAPGNALVLRGASMLARSQGRLDQAIHLCRRALEQDPLSVMAYNSLGLALHDADRSAKAEVAYRKALELGPNRNGTSTDLSVTLLAQGRAEEAVAEARRDPDEAIRLWAVAIVQHARGQRAKSDEALRELTARNTRRTAPFRSPRCTRPAARRRPHSSGWSARTRSGTAGSP